MLLQKDDDGNYIDPHNGISDINEKIIRTVGNPFERFCEDPLRVLRALRFKIVLGFDFDDDLNKALYNELVIEKIKTIKVERIREEMFKMFKFDSFSSLIVISKYPEIFKVIFDLHSTLKLIPTISPTFV